MGNKRIGKNMKPRAKKEEKSPAAAGQPESILEPVLSKVEVAQPPVNQTPEEVQNLDSNTLPENVIYVAEEGEEGAEVEDGAAAIAEALAGYDKLAADLMRPPEETPTQTATVLPTAEDLDAAVEQGGHNVVELDGSPGTFIIPADHQGQVTLQFSGGKMMGHELLDGLGEQTDGSYKAVVTIKEGYWNAIEEWAAADGITPEEWLTNIITANIETYAMPAKGR